MSGHDGVTYMSKARAAEILKDANVQGVPEFVIEIGSPSTRRRDEAVKGLELSLEDIFSL